MCLKGFWCIRPHKRDRVAFANAKFAERRGEKTGARVGLRPRVASSAVNNRRLVRIDACGSLNKIKRSQRSKVCRVLIKALFVFIHV